MGVVKQEERISEDEWQRRATASAIAAARAVASGDNINQRATIGSLSDIEWGWIVASSIFGWIKTRAEQATYEGTSPDVTVQRMTGNPSAWDAGAVASILPALGSIPGVDWEVPIGAWSKDQIVYFSWQIFHLVNSAMANRDEVVGPKILRFSQEKAEREASAGAGGPLMSRKEMNDDIPF